MTQPRHSRSRERSSLPLARPLLVALAAAGLCGPSALYAATIVATGGDPALPSAGTCSLRQAVAALNTATVAGTACTNSGSGFGTNDTVDLIGLTGAITLGGTQIDVTVSMKINGPGATVLNISGNNASRIFDVTTDGAQFGISNVTLSNGLASGSGGCIRAIPTTYANTTSAYLYGVTVDSCTATLVANATVARDFGAGGGIAADEATLIQSTVSRNTAVAGGGIFAQEAFLIASVVTANTVAAGSCTSLGPSKYCLGGGGVLAGGAYLKYSTVSGNTVNASVITGTSGTYAFGIGGGLTVLGFGTAPATANAARTRVSPATAQAPKYGAIILLSTVSGNRIVGPGASGVVTKYLGGGSFGYATGVIDSTISGNNVTKNGYASGIFSGLMLLLNSTITANTGLGGVVGIGTPMAPAGALAAAVTAKPSAVAAWLRHSSAPLVVQPQLPFVLEIDSTIVAGNAGPGPDMLCPGPPCTFTGGTSLVGKADTSVTLPPDTILNKDPMLGPLADNGGVLAGAPGGIGTGHVPTHLLSAGSPAIDKGSNLANLKSEERGPGFPRKVGIQADIGATEGPKRINASEIPALDFWPLVALSALLGALGWRRRRRSG